MWIKLDLWMVILYHKNKICKLLWDLKKLNMKVRIIKQRDLEYQLSALIIISGFARRVLIVTTFTRRKERMM
jgi:hypothetical protein